MKRIIDHHLLNWKANTWRKALLLRGARQVGKTYAVRQFGKTFDSFVEINLESQPEFRNIFQEDLDPHRIIRDITLINEKPIIPGKTLLFFDEIQIVPQALTALRYFYEIMPELHVVAAGSLLDFAIQSVGIPVGRVQSLYMYPLSFIEFLIALNKEILAKKIVTHNLDKPVSKSVHEKILKLMGQYLAIGGMPEVVALWQEKQSAQECFELHHVLIDTYRQDFNKYANKFQIKYVTTLFNNAPIQLGKKFKYSDVEGDYRKRELAPCLDLLETAGVLHTVLHTAAQGLPLGAQVNHDIFKLLFLDVGLTQSMLGQDARSWLLDPLQEFVNKGAIVEAFVGQELLAYANPHQKQQLYYWQRAERSSNAEIDYVTAIKSKIIPIEVKSGAGTTLKSMHMFLEQHAASPYGIRFSTQNYSRHEKIHSYPLYAIAHALEFDIPLPALL